MLMKMDDMSRKSVHPSGYLMSSVAVVRVGSRPSGATSSSSISGRVTFSFSVVGAAATAPSFLGCFFLENMARGTMV